MGGNNWDKIHMWQNRAAGAVDRAIAREKRMKANGTWKEPEEPKIPSVNSWEGKYPSYPRWEDAIYQISNRRIDDILRELRDYGDMNKVPRQAYDWIRGMYNDRVEPRDAWAKIKEKLGW
jgi:hypothetical protein